MSRTKKDLKSYKSEPKPSRKMTPMSLDADRITGDHHNLVFIDNDMKQDDFYLDDINETKDPNDTHWHNAKSVRSIRKQKRAERDEEKSSARSRLRMDLKNQINNPSDEEFD